MDYFVAQDGTVWFNHDEAVEYDNGNDAGESDGE